MKKNLFNEIMTVKAAPMSE